MHDWKCPHCFKGGNFFRLAALQILSKLETDWIKYPLTSYHCSLTLYPPSFFFTYVLQETGVLHGDAGDDINKAVVCEKWASDPLTLSPVPGTSKTGPGARLSARGVAQDKANVVCQLAAIEALVNGPTMTLPCGVKVKVV